MQHQMISCFKILAKIKWSLTVVVIIVAMLFLSRATGVNVLDCIYYLHMASDSFPICHVLSIVCLVVLGAFLDYIVIKRRNQHKIEFQIRQLKTFKATMNTVNHIVNNGLNQLLLMRIEAESNNTLPPDSLTMFDTLIFEISAKLQDLGNIETLTEKKIADDIYHIDYQTRP